MQCQEPEDNDDQQDSHDGEQEDLPRFVDNPALDEVQPYVDDLYFATALPRFDADPVCLRRQRKNASAAAGALTNALGKMDCWTNQPPRPTDRVGEERAESLEVGARVLIR